jgi:hypothetical protein
MSERLLEPSETTIRRQTSPLLAALCVLGHQPHPRGGRSRGR